MKAIVKLGTYHLSEKMNFHTKTHLFILVQTVIQMFNF